MTKPNNLILLLAFVIVFGCSNSKLNEEDFAVAFENGKLANEAFARSLKLTKAWNERKDLSSGLIPTNFSNRKDVWEPHNSAADNYAFMVLTSYLLDQQLLDTDMLEMLKNEKKLTSRIKSLPDTYSFSKQDFKYDEPNLNRIIFGTSEYIKDGLLPIMEYTGNTPWSERMMEMLNDLPEVYSVMTQSKKLEWYKAVSEEVNGEMLQTLSRIYWKTGDPQYLDWAIKIGDYYLLDGKDLSEVEYLRLRDHGCEVIGGLSELYVTLHFALPEKKKEYQEKLYKLFDRVLEVGRNEDGLFYNGVNTITGEIADGKIVDNWGYIFNAFYSIYLVDDKQEYRQAFIDGIQRLNEKYKNYLWEGTSHDGYADALESGINLYNREPIESLKKWIDSEIKVMWNMQKEDGIVGGWHGDGNFSRTSIMYGLWKTQGVFCTPWRSDLRFGAEKGNDGELLISVSADQSWEGILKFDFQRHKRIMNLPIDYPRINQFPEWFTVIPENNYSIVSNTKDFGGAFSGEELMNGIPVRLEKNKPLLVKVNLQ